MGLKILAFGEVLWDIIDGTPYIGGAPLNFCGHCARLGNESYILSSIGTDELGIQTRETLRDIGVSDKYVSTVDYPTGIVPVKLTNGMPVYEIKTGSAWDNISLSEPQLKEIRDTLWDVFYIGTLAQRTASNRKTLDLIFDSRVKAKRVFYDVNLRQTFFTVEIIKKTLLKSDIVKINDEELVLLHNMFSKLSISIDSFISYFIDTFKIEILCITYGSEGAVIYKDSQKYVFKSEKVDAISTIGAGDSFSAGLVHGLMTTGSITKAGELAIKIAAYVVTCQGALPDYRELL